MRFLSGRVPLLLAISWMTTNCTEPAPGPDLDDTESSDTGYETVVPTTGPEPNPTATGNLSTDTEDVLTDTGDEPTATSDESGAAMSEGGADEASGASSTGYPPVCGDAVIDPGEECDAGFEANTVNSACLPDCSAASCGDGFVNLGVEDCDLGSGNSFEYGGCNPQTCKWGPRCGDGQVDAPNEVCDPGEPNGRGDGIALCDDSCRFEGRIVFLSSVKYDGDLGGLAGADKQCRDLAAKFDAPNADTYRAWLSDGEGSPYSRFAHGPEFDGVPYVLRNGVEIAADFNDLVSYGPWAAIDLTDTGEVLTWERVWSNTGVDGQSLTMNDDCDGWTGTADYVGRYGINGVPADSPDLDAWKVFGEWTTGASIPCLKYNRLYCFEN